MYTLTFAPAAFRIFKKLSSQLQEEMRDRAEILSTNPLVGEPLQGKYRHFLSHRLSSISRRKADHS